MGMHNPHNPEQVLWQSLTHWFEILGTDPHNKNARENAEYYTEQWFKQCEKRVISEMKSLKIKQTAGDKLPKITPKADKLSQK